MTSQWIIFAGLVTVSCVHATNTNHVLESADKEARTLIPTPLFDIIGTILVVVTNLAPLITNVILPIINFKLAAFTLIATAASWLYQHYFAVIIGTVLVLGYCVISGTYYTEELLEMDHRLIQAARQLDAGTLKYARMIN